MESLNLESKVDNMYVFYRNVIYCLIEGNKQNYIMQSKLQIEDDEATLNLARQIGMKAKCIPTLNLPKKQQKFRFLHLKLAMKHLKHNQIHPIEPRTPEKIAVITSKQKKYYQTPPRKNFTERRHRLCKSLRRQAAVHDNLLQQQEKGIRTARTSICQRNSFICNNSSTSNQLVRGNSTILQDKTSPHILLQLWNEQKLKTLLLPKQEQNSSCNNYKSEQNQNKSLIFWQKSTRTYNMEDKIKKSNKKRIHIRYNPGVSSFQFY